MNVQQAAKRLGKSEPTIRRWIREGKLQATMVDGVYDIPESAVNEQSVSSQITEDERDGEIAAMRTHIQSLERQLTEKDEQIKELQAQFGEASHRHDTVVMQMTRLIEYHQQPFWRRLFSRKALPPPVDETIMDMEPGGDKAKE